MKTHIAVAVRGSLAAAIAVLAQVANPTIGHALPTIASLAVSPAHGQVRSSFTLTYQQTPCVLSQLPQGTEIRFSWNGAPPAGQLLGSATTDSTCKATLVSSSPANAGVGSHEVDGYVPIPQDGSPATGTQATASYTVDAAPGTKPTATPNAGATATPGVSGTSGTQSGNPQAGATPAASASGGTGAGGNGSNNAGSSTGKGASNGNGASNGSGTSGNQSTGFGPPPYLGTPLGLLSVPLTFGFILLLLLLVIALLLWAMAERRRSDKAAAAASKRAA
jgi:hypothetical protein